MNVGFIGTGQMGLYQARNFSAVKGWRIVAGSDVSELARAEFAKKYPGTAVYADHRDLLKDRQVEAVVVVVPTLFHKTVAIEALRAGRPVLCEKPMARTVTDCKRMLDVAEKTGQFLMIAHCRRYDEHWAAWADVIRRGDLGFPILWRDACAGLSPGRWFMDEKISGGPLFDGAIHNYDFANFLWGKPESVIASAIKLQSDVTAIDTATAVVRYENGCQLMVSWSWAVRATGMHDVLGPKGSLQWGTGGQTPPEEDKERSSYFCVTDGQNQKRLVRATSDFDNMYRHQAQHFLDCIEGRAKCQTPGTEAIKAVAVSEAVLKAAARGGSKKVMW